MIPKMTFRSMRDKIRHTVSSDTGMQALLEGAKQHHALAHHMSQIEGAATCLLGSGTRRLKNSTGTRAIGKKPLSSYFMDDDTAMDAIYDAIINGTTASGKQNINMLTGFLLNAPVDHSRRNQFTLHLRTNNNPEDYVYGYRLSQDTSARTPEGEPGAIKEHRATSVTIVIRKTSQQGDFEITNMYPICTEDDMQHETDPRELQRKIEATDAYKRQIPVRQAETSLRIFQRDDTPSVYVANGKLCIDFDKLGGPLVCVSKEKVESPDLDTQSATLRAMRISGLSEQASAILELAKSLDDPTRHPDAIRTIMQPRTMARGLDESNVNNDAELCV